MSCLVLIYQTIFQFVFLAVLLAKVFGLITSFHLVSTYTSLLIMLEQVVYKYSRVVMRSDGMMDCYINPFNGLPQNHLPLRQWLHEDSRDPTTLKGLQHHWQN